MINNFPNIPNMFIWVKDSNLKFIDCNENFVEYAGVDSSHQLKGMDDFQMSWRSQAKFYREVDCHSLKGKTYINQQEELETCKGKIQMLVTKAPLYNQAGECIGVIGSGINITGYWLKKKQGIYDVNTGLFYLGEEYGNEYLTKRELEVLKLILLGYVSRQIAAFLNISIRTVESYVEILKDKLQCRSKGEIILAAIQAGFLYLIEENI